MFPYIYLKSKTVVNNKFYFFEKKNFFLQITTVGLRLTPYADTATVELSNGVCVCVCDVSRTHRRYSIKTKISKIDVAFE